jgi:hypothetical protein
MGNQEVKHTPEKWTVVQHPDPDVCIPSVASLVGGATVEFCTIYGGACGSPEEAQYRARLIAASPALLEACKEISAHWESGNANRDRAIWDRLDAAIKLTTQPNGGAA